MAKQTRTKRTDEEKRAIIEAFRARRAAEPGLTRRTYADEIGVDASLMRRWEVDLQIEGLREGKDVGESAASERRKRGTIDTAKISAWLEKHGSRMKADMGDDEESSESAANGTLISAPLARVAFEPRKRSEPEPEAPRQPELPFRAEPVQREPAPVHTLLGDTARQALQERDALMVVLQMMIRNNGGKLPGQ